MAYTVEQLEKLVGQEHGAEPVSHTLPHRSSPHSHTQLRLAGTSETSSPTLSELVQRHPTSNSYMVPCCLFLLLFLVSHPSFLLQNLVQFPTFPLVNRALNTLSSDPSFAAFPTYPVVLFLKGLPLSPLHLTNHLTPFFRCRPGCHQLCWTHQGKQCHQGTSHI
jgi:hypothetical protein